MAQFFSPTSRPRSQGTPPWFLSWRAGGWPGGLRVVLVGVLWGLGAGPGWAVETIGIEWGWFRQQVAIADIQQVLDTGEIPDSLGLWGRLLTPTLQATLRNPLSLEPVVGDRFLADLQTSQQGQRLSQALQRLAPGLSPSALQTAFTTAVASEAPFNSLDLLRALPGDTLTLHGPSLLSALTLTTLAHLEQTALSHLLQQAIPENSPWGQALDPAQPGDQPYEYWELVVRGGDRPIPVDLYLPEQSQGPLVVLSHGFGADRFFLRYLAEHLASHGLTVAAIEHPGSNVQALMADSGPLLPPTELIRRPQEVSQVLDRLGELNSSTYPFRGRINLEAVTLVGHSLGGYTGLALAGATLDLPALSQSCQDLGITRFTPADWLQCTTLDLEPEIPDLKDDRITQLVILNPIIGDLFGSQGVSGVRIPTLMVTSTQDGVTPASSQQFRPFEQLAGPKALVAVIGATHLSVGSPENINPAITQIPFMPEVPASTTAPLRQYLQGVVLSFVQQSGSRGDRYRPFLSMAYAQRFTQPDLAFYYGETLPAPLQHWLTAQNHWQANLGPTGERLASLAHLQWLNQQQAWGRSLDRLGRQIMAQWPLSTLLGQTPRSQPEPQGQVGRGGGS